MYARVHVVVPSSPSYHLRHAVPITRTTAQGTRPLHSWAQGGSQHGWDFKVPSFTQQLRPGVAPRRSLQPLLSVLSFRKCLVEEGGGGREGGRWEQEEGAGGLCKDMFFRRQTRPLLQDLQCFSLWAVTHFSEVGPESLEKPVSTHRLHCLHLRQ